MSKGRTTVPRMATAALATLALAFFGCSDGSSPTEPGPPSPGAGGSATVAGQVASAGGSGGGVVAAGSAARIPVGTSGEAAASAVSGITVRIQGTGLTTTTDAQGRFGLSGVPAGDRVVMFETAAAQAHLPIPSVQEAERIELTVALQGSTVVVQSMERSTDPEDPTVPADLRVEMQPDTWNTNWVGSSGSVSALIRGEGFDRIDLDSIELLGTDPDAPPLAPFRVDREGNHVRAFFAKRDAIAILDDPQPGEVHTLTLKLTVEGEATTLTTEVRVVGPESPQEEASIDVEKATNGADADRAPGPTIPVGDPVEWTYVVTNTGDVPLEDVVVTDDQGVAVDCPADALEPGESMTCTGSGTAEEGQYRNVATATGRTEDGDEVEDEDASHYFGEAEEPPEPVDLAAEMQPDSWNTNWANSSGTVSAFIRGSGFERIDLDSILLIGSDPGAAPLAPTRVDRQGNHVRAFFAQRDAIAILDDPDPGETHTLILELTVEGEPVSLTVQVRVVGPPK